MDLKLNNWNTTPNINTGCNTNCTIGLVPIKWDQLLNVSSEKTEEKFIVKCCARKNTRNRPERAIATFLAIEADNIPISV